MGQHIRNMAALSTTTKETPGQPTEAPRMVPMVRRTQVMETPHTTTRATRGRHMETPRMVLMEHHVRLTETRFIAIKS